MNDTVKAGGTSTNAGDAWPSARAILIGFGVIFALSLATDELLHLLKVYPPWSQPMYSPSLNLLALSYRLVYDVYGSYLTAKLAPHTPMRHALILGAIGFVFSALAVVATGSKGLGPSWYPIALAVSALPSAWLGGYLYERRRGTR